MALTKDEQTAISRLQGKFDVQAINDELLQEYYQGQQRVENLGMAIPPNMRRFMVIVNWPRVVVDTIVSRQQVRHIVTSAEETTDPKLRAIYDGNNLSAHLRMFQRDRCIYGRAFLSVGANPRNPQVPLVRVESPRQMVAEVDARTEQITAAARFFRSTDQVDRPDRCTLYLPDVTVWCGVDKSGWVEISRDQHGLGKVPVVMHLNRRLSGAWLGESEMTDIIPLTDAAVRALTNMQFTQEAHGAPRKYMTGVAQGDFVGPDGKPIPKWEAYFDAMHLITDSNAKVGQLDAADLKNFETAIDIYSKQAATVTGFPARLFGLTTANPPTEGSIRADEAALIRSVESQNEETGTTIADAMALSLRFATGSWSQGVQIDWFDPATPTIAQRMDAIVKAKSVGILSREGSWDELGWSEARKSRERSYFASEVADPVMAQYMAMVNGGSPAGVTPAAG